MRDRILTCLWVLNTYFLHHYTNKLFKNHKMWYPGFLFYILSLTVEVNLCRGLRASLIFLSGTAICVSQILFCPNVSSAGKQGIKWKIITVIVWTFFQYVLERETEYIVASLYKEETEVSFGLASRELAREQKQKTQQHQKGVLSTQRERYL